MVDPVAVISDRLDQDAIMALPTQIIPPSSSWWCQPNREAFREALDAERDRLRQIAPYVQAAFEQPGDTKTSRPVRDRRES